VKIMSLSSLVAPRVRARRQTRLKNKLRDRHEEPGINVRVINASWGGGSNSQSLRDAISAANDAGILFVCAAGNGSTNMTTTRTILPPIP